MRSWRIDHGIYEKPSLPAPPGSLGFLPIFGWDRPVLRELFTADVFRFLREKELLSAERNKLPPNTLDT